MKKVLKHNSRKERSTGYLARGECIRCGLKGRGMIRKYGLQICRRCFREVAKTMGWKKAD